MHNILDSNYDVETSAYSPCKTLGLIITGPCNVGMDYPMMKILLLLLMKIVCFFFWSFVFVICIILTPGLTCFGFFVVGLI